MTTLPPLGRSGSTTSAAYSLGAARSGSRATQLVAGGGGGPLSRGMFGDSRQRAPTGTFASRGRSRSSSNSSSSSSSSSARSGTSDEDAQGEEGGMIAVGFSLEGGGANAPKMDQDAAAVSATTHPHDSVAADPRANGRPRSGSSHAATSSATAATAPGGDGTGGNTPARPESQNRRKSAIVLPTDEERAAAAAAAAAKMQAQSRRLADAFFDPDLYRERKIAKRQQDLRHANRAHESAQRLLDVGRHLPEDAAAVLAATNAVASGLALLPSNAAPGTTTSTGGVSAAAISAALGLNASGKSAGIFSDKSKPPTSATDAAREQQRALKVANAKAQKDGNEHAFNPFAPGGRYADALRRSAAVTSGVRPVALGYTPLTCLIERGGVAGAQLQQPPALEDATLVAFAHEGVMVLFGGFMPVSAGAGGTGATVSGGGGGQAQSRTSNDTWLYDQATQSWTCIQGLPGAVPPPRCGHSAVAMRDDPPPRVVRGVHHRGGSTHAPRPQSGTATARVFEGGLNVEATLSGTSGSIFDLDVPGQAADPGPLMIVFGGADLERDVAFNDVWAFHVRSRRWHCLFAPPGPPMPRGAMRFLPPTSVMFGGVGHSAVPDAGAFQSAGSLAAANRAAGGGHAGGWRKPFSYFPDGLIAPNSASPNRPGASTVAACNNTSFGAGSTTSQRFLTSSTPAAMMTRRSVELEPGEAALLSLAASAAVPAVVDVAPPVPRWRCAAAAIDYRLVVFGGESAAFDVLGDVHVFDCASGRWVSHRGDTVPAPSPRCMHASCVIGDKMVVSGGVGPQVDAPLVDDTWVLDLRLLSWRPLAATTDEIAAATTGTGGLSPAAAALRRPSQTPSVHHAQAADAASGATLSVVASAPPRSPFLETAGVVALPGSPGVGLSPALTPLAARPSITTNHAGSPLLGGTAVAVPGGASTGYKLRRRGIVGHVLVPLGDAVLLHGGRDPSNGREIPRPACLDLLCEKWVAPSEGAWLLPEGAGGAGAAGGHPLQHVGPSRGVSGAAGNLPAVGAVGPLASPASALPRAPGVPGTLDAAPVILCGGGDVARRLPAPRFGHCAAVWVEYCPTLDLGLAPSIADLAASAASPLLGSPSAPHLSPAGRMTPPATGSAASILNRLGGATSGAGLADDRAATAYLAELERAVSAQKSFTGAIFSRHGRPLSSRTLYVTFFGGATGGGGGGARRTQLADAWHLCLGEPADLAACGPPPAPVSTTRARTSQAMMMPNSNGADFNSGSTVTAGTGGISQHNHHLSATGTSTPSGKASNSRRASISAAFLGGGGSAGAKSGGATATQFVAPSSVGNTPMTTAATPAGGRGSIMKTRF